MSIITIFTYYDHPKRMLPLYNILNQIKTGRYRYLVERLRECYEDDPGGEFDSLARIIPRFSVSGNFILKRDKVKMVSYSGNLLLEIPYLNERDRKSVKKLLQKDPFVMACFENALKSGLVILVRGNGQSEKHKANFKLAVKYYKNLTGAKIFALGGMRLNHTCMVSLDEDIYIKVGAESFTEHLKGLVA